LPPAIFAGALVAGNAPSSAQVFDMRPKILVPPWNVQRPFEATVLPQLTDPDSRDPVAPEDTPVRTRVHPDFQPREIRFGDWMVSPSAAAGFRYDSNVFSTPNNPQSDFAARFDGGLHAHTLWERHGIDIKLLADNLTYKRNPGLNQTDATLLTTGHYDIDHATQVLGAFTAAFLHDEVGSLTSPAGAVEPTPYSQLSGNVALRKQFGRATATIGTSIDSYNFGSTRAQNGSIINQDSRDGQIYVGYGRFDYAFSDKSAVFTSVEGNARDLRGTPTQSLSSQGYRTLAGFDLEFTHLIKGELGAGYMSQRFDSATIGTIEGPTYRAMLTWSPSRRLDIYFNAEQLVTEASDTSATGILANAFQLGFDYEFRPNVILSTAGMYERDSFKGQPRLDNLYMVDTRLKYLMNRVTSINFLYRFTRRDSTNDAASYDKHRFGISAAAQF
jgi:hypothetical protein